MGDTASFFGVYEGTVSRTPHLGIHDLKQRSWGKADKCAARVGVSAHSLIGQSVIEAKSSR